MTRPAPALALALLAASSSALAGPRRPPSPRPVKAGGPALIYAVEVSDGLRVTTRLNGFSLEDLVVSTDRGERVDEFQDAIAVSLVHPYFLRRDNVVTTLAYLEDSLVADDAPGPWPLRVRLGQVDRAARPDFMEAWVDQAVARLALPGFTRAAPGTRTASTRFVWSAPLPVWGWTRAPRLRADDATRDAVYGALVAFHAELSALSAGGPGAARSRRALQARLEASTRDYRTASALYGRPDRFVAALLAAVATRSLPGDAEIQAAVRDQARRPSPSRPTPRDDEQDPPDPADYAGPHLTLMDLAPKEELRLELMGDGRLARLVPGSYGPTIVMRSNWPDGGWGAVGDAKVEAEVWFRQDAAGRWVIDALVDGHTRYLSLLDDGLDQLADRSGLW